MDRRDVVRDDADRLAFVARLSDTVLTRQWVLHAWILMTNHLHLVVETPLANLSQGMRDLLSPFASRFNLVHDRVGHLFQHRFGAKVVERETHLLELLRYVPLNPVRARLVRSPEQWPWGSYRATAGFEPAPPWLEVGWTLDQFDPTNRETARTKYREFVSHARNVEYDPHAATVAGWILGSEAFCERVQSWIDERERSREHPKRQLRLMVPEFSRLLEIVRCACDGEDDPLKPRSRGPARKIVADLGHDVCGLTFERIAEALGTTPWAAAKLRVRSRELEREDPLYAELIRRIRRELEG